MEEPHIVPPEVIELERIATKAGLKMREVLDHAHVPYTAWWRWKTRGIDPRLSSLRRIRESIDTLTSRARSA